MRTLETRGNTETRPKDQLPETRGNSETRPQDQLVTATHAERSQMPQSEIPEPPGSPSEHRGVVQRGQHSQVPSGNPKGMQARRPPDESDPTTLRCFARWVCLLSVATAFTTVVFAQESTGDAGVYPSEVKDAVRGAQQAIEKGDDAKAIELYLQAAEMAHSADAKKQAAIWYELGNAYRRLNQQDEAVGAYTRALDIVGEEDTELRSRILNAQGIAYRHLSRYKEAIESFQRAVALREAAADLLGLTRARANLAGLYQLQGKYALALSAYRQALDAAGQIQSPPRGLLADLRADIGLVLSELGDYRPALQEFEAGLNLLKGTADPGREGRLLHNMGFAYFRSAEVERSVEVYRRALSLRRQTKDRRGEGKTLNNLGFAYAKLGRHKEALKALEEGLAIAHELGDRATEGRTVDSIATVYMKTGQDVEALAQLHVALAIKREIGDRGGEHVTLANIGRTYVAKDDLSLAIVFLKQSVNVTEAIRRELGTLPKEAQQAYTETVAATYRLLADLLLRENRILEAERVIDLLKVEELDDYLGGVRGAPASMSLTPEEEEIQAMHRALLERSIVLGRELAQLEAIKPGDRNVEQKERIRELRDERGRIKKAFEEFKDNPQVVEALKKQDPTQTVNPEQLVKLSEKLDKDAALLYPLILPDRLELIFATKEAIPTRVPQSVSEQQLKEAIFAFRQALANRSGDAKALGQRLYGWLIKPVEEALAKAGIKTIVYVPDGQLRYVPLAALHDGEDWLVRKFRVNLITALTLTDFTRLPSRISAVLAGALTTDQVVDVAGSRLSFRGLPFARREVEELATLYPGATKFFDDDFTPGRLVPAFEDNEVVHLATHGLFVPGRPAHESFILFAKGERATLPEIKETWLLGKVDLVVLSACETGVGGTLGNGEEIHGFGYLMQNAGANAVLASLWKVSDGGTRALMSAFYRHLKQPGISKAEALRLAQLDLIDNKGSEKETAAARGVDAGDPATQEDAQPRSVGFAEPYYWAPFILIGNGR